MPSGPVDDARASSLDQAAGGEPAPGDGGLDAPPAGIAHHPPPADVVILPESPSYRLKKALLGPPLVTERLSVERLSKPMALGVLSPDCISSTAYGSEEILFVLVRAVGVAAFSLLLPITLAVIVVLLFVTLSYREVVMVYTRAGGSYVVARENFGVKVAQIAAVALIIDYIVTVAVQVAAGTEALSSAFPALAHWDLEISLIVVAVMCYGNLRGIREAGRVFALPTYLFVTATGSLIIIGLIRAALGQLHAHPIPLHAGVVPLGTPGSGLLYGAGIIIVLRAFANGGSSLTGLEAISNGVSNFRPPEGQNARRVLVVMAIILGSLVSGVSLLAHITHAVPYEYGTPTVLSQEAKYVFGSAWFGRFGFYFVQGATMLILWTGGNTSFNGFPNLASFVAEDSFLPRQLTRRGHRLVFSNGIIILAIAAEALLVGTDARLNILVGVYAVGVFTGFTMAGFGMVKHHLRLRERGWKHRMVINGFAGFLSLSVVLIFVIVKFREGVWIVVVLFIILVPTLIRLHKQYEEERRELEENVNSAAVAPVLRRHVVLVFVDHLDLAAARALQYARTLNPDDLRAVHFVLDSVHSAELEAQWVQLGLVTLSPRRRRVPRPASDEGGDGADRRGGRGRPDRGQRPLAAPRLLGGVAARPARSHRRPHRGLRRPAAERQRHDRAVPAGQASQAARPLAGGGRAGLTGHARRRVRHARVQPGCARGRGQDRRRAGCGLPERLHERARLGHGADRQPPLTPAGAGRGTDQDRPRPATGRCLLARVHHLRRERAAAGPVPGPPPRGRDRAGGSRRRRGHGGCTGTQPGHGEPALLDHLDLEAGRERASRQGPPSAPPLRGVESN